MPRDWFATVDQDPYPDDGPDEFHTEHRWQRHAIVSELRTYVETVDDDDDYDEIDARLDPQVVLEQLTEQIPNTFEIEVTIGGELKPVTVSFERGYVAAVSDIRALPQLERGGEQIPVIKDPAGLDWKEWAAREHVASEDPDGIFRMTPKGYMLAAELLAQASTDSSLGGDRSRHTTQLFKQTSDLLGALAATMLEMAIAQREVEKPKDGQRK